MRPERVEELLRSRPPDEPAYRGKLLLGVPTAPAIRPEVRRRGPITTAFSATTIVAVVIGLLVVGLVTGPLAAKPSTGPLPSPAAQTPYAPSLLGVIPWVDATPTPPPTPEPTLDAHSLDACTSNDLVLAADGWGGATGSLAGGASIVNVSSTTCTVGGKPAIQLLDDRGTVIARDGTAKSASGAVVVLAPGGVATVITVWGNWCGGVPGRPLRLRVSLPGVGGDLIARIREVGPGSRDEVPRCDSPGGAGSTIGVPLAFSAPDPSEGGYEPRACGADELAAYLGDWGAAAGTSYANLLVLNVDGFDCLLD